MPVFSEFNHVRKHVPGQLLISPDGNRELGRGLERDPAEVSQEVLREKRRLDSFLQVLLPDFFVEENERVEFQKEIEPRGGGEAGGVQGE